MSLIFKHQRHVAYHLVVVLTHLWNTCNFIWVSLFQFSSLLHAVSRGKRMPQEQRKKPVAKRKTADDITRLAASQAINVWSSLSHLDKIQKYKPSPHKDFWKMLHYVGSSKILDWSLLHTDNPNPTTSFHHKYLSTAFLLLSFSFCIKSYWTPFKSRKTSHAVWRQPVSFPRRVEMFLQSNI